MTTLAFGIGSLALRDAGRIVAYSKSPGMLFADVSQEPIATKGGASPFPIGASGGQSSGELTITLNERPEWVESLLSSSVPSQNQAAAGTIERKIIAGSSLQETFPTSITFRPLTAGTPPAVGEYQLEALSGNRIKITAITAKGTFIMPNLDAPTSGNPLIIRIAPPNVEIIIPARTYTEGDAIAYRVGADTRHMHNRLDVGNAPNLREFELLVYTLSSKKDRIVYEYDFPRVVLTTAPIRASAGRNMSARLEGFILAGTAEPFAYRRNQYMPNA